MPESASFYSLLVTVVLLAHMAIVFFLVGGFLAIVAGNLLGWRWVNGFRFRLGHLLLMVFVMAESWLGITCPLTTWENWLRVRAGQATYEESFVGYWLRRLLYYEAPPWLFVAGYSAFVLMVLAAWRYFPPRSRFSPPLPDAGTGAGGQRHQSPG